MAPGRLVRWPCSTFTSRLGVQKDQLSFHCPRLVQLLAKEGGRQAVVRRPATRTRHKKVEGKAQRLWSISFLLEPRLQGQGEGDVKYCTGR